MIQEQAEQQPQRHYYFTWGTLKRGFSNHQKYKEVLKNYIGEFRTEGEYSLIVPKQQYCVNPDCSLVHRMGALTLPLEGYGKPVTGEVYGVDEAGLAALDSLENYKPDDPANSTYLRKLIKVVSKDTQIILSAYCYFIQDDSGFVDLLLANQAEAVVTYTIEMSQGDLKNCCLNDPGHSGAHDVMQLPTINRAAEV